MYEKMKCIELSKMLTDWEFTDEMRINFLMCKQPKDEGWYPFVPYSDCKDGRSQFAAILLKFPDAMESFCKLSPGCARYEGSHYYKFEEPTQSNLLDEVLRKNGVNPDEHWRSLKNQQRKGVRDE